MNRLIDAQISPDGQLAAYAPEAFNIDNILSGRSLIFLHKLSAAPRYLTAIGRLSDQLSKHPNISTGNYWHKLRYPHQVWLDGLYMGLPFQVEAAQLRGDDTSVQDALNQMLSAMALTYDASTQLYHHGYDEARAQAWANQQTGLSSAHWARALGWLAMACVDLLDLLPPSAKRDDLAQRATALASQLLAHQQPDGRWLQVIDQPALNGNYAESSATAMLAYFFLKAERLDLPVSPGAQSHAETGRAALNGLRQSAMTGTPPKLRQICHIAGLGGFEGRERDGTAGYYVSEVLLDDDIKGVGPLMMAHAEFLRFQSA